MQRLDDLIAGSQRACPSSSSSTQPAAADFAALLAGTLEPVRPARPGPAELWPERLPRVGDADDIAALLGAPTTGAPGRADPWTLGLLPARAAHAVGVRADRPVAEVAADLRWIDDHSPTAQVVPLVGRARRELAEAFGGLEFVRVAVTVEAAGVEEAVLAALAGAARVELDVSDLEGARRVGRLAAAGSAQGADVIARVALGAPDAEALVCTVQTSGVPFTDDGADPAFVSPELQGSLAFRQRAAASSARPGRLERALEGVCPERAALAGPVRDLVWSHPDEPAAHSRWLRRYSTPPAPCGC